MLKWGYVMGNFADVIKFLDENIAWGPHLVLLILGSSIFFSIKTGFIQLRGLKKGFKLLFGNNAKSEGEVSRFGALCTSLAATIGTGNIVGVASALSLGGPGALLWMVIAAFFGMALSYAEGLLAVRYRIKINGTLLGGPFYYIENGLGKKFKPFSKLFAFCGTVAGTFGIGTIIQANSISAAVDGFFKNETAVIYICGNEVSTITLICGIAVTVAVSLVIIGGIKRISKVAEFFVPFMSVIYLTASIAIIATNISQLPEALKIILCSAFSPKSVLGAAAGISFKSALQMGVSRGIFSNEAGLGSAPIAAAAAKGEEPVEQGLVSMLATFIDTVVLCSITGIGLVVTDAWKLSSLHGVGITAYAWKNGLPISPTVCDLALMLCLIFFAFSSIIGWNFYTERCLKYLCGGKERVVKIHRIFYILAVLLGGFISAPVVWGVANIFNALMALPNLLALLLLSKKVVSVTKSYFNRNIK